MNDHLDEARVVLSRPITLDDVPDVWKLLASWNHGGGYPTLIFHVLSRVVEHLNANGGISDDDECIEDVQDELDRTMDDFLYVANERDEYERAYKECQEELIELSEQHDKLKKKLKDTEKKYAQCMEDFEESEEDHIQMQELLKYERAEVVYWRNKWMDQLAELKDAEARAKIAETERCECEATADLVEIGARGLWEATRAEGAEVVRWDQAHEVEQNQFRILYRDILGQEADR